MVQTAKSPSNHNHGSSTHTSCDYGHSHQCLDISGIAIPTGDSHVHHSENFVLYEHGHTHYYKAVSSVSIPLKNGWHAHNWDFYTTVDNGHRHQISGVDMAAPGI
ncbi:MAG: YmaF family protein [Dehalobacter sp.]|nr:YmaF family protein [Dehalobacter sp.]